MKNKVIIGLSTTVVMLILVGVVAAMSATIRRQKREIIALEEKAEKAEKEREAAQNFAEKERKINEKYKKINISSKNSLSVDDIDDFNSLIRLYNDR